MDARTRRINGIIERSTSNEKWPEGGRGGGRGQSRGGEERERERELWWLVTMPCYGGGRVIMIL